MEQPAQHFLIQIFQQNIFSAYFLFYLAIIFLGNVFSFIGFLLVIKAQLGLGYLFLMFIVVFLADISGDILWFHLGKFLRDTKLGYFILNRFNKHNLKFEEIVNKNGMKWYFFGKFFYTSSIIVFMLGWAQKEFKKFIKTSLIITVFMIFVVYFLSIGIILGLTSLANVTKIFNRLEWLFIIGLPLFILLEFIISKIIKKILSIDKFKKLFKFLFNNNNDNELN